MKKIKFRLMCKENKLESTPFCVKIFSTNEKAKAALLRGNEKFPHLKFWIEPIEIDCFTWKAIFKKGIK